MVGTDEHSTAHFTLYVWPGQWQLPSLDPTCLATIFYLQLAIPGEFSISECNNPDISPSGQLPFLVHGQFTVSSLPSITRYIAGLKKSNQSDLDAHLTPSERSQQLAWISHVESHFGNLIYHNYYSCIGNWEKVIHPALVGMYGLPQRYYVPGRIRASYKPRLEGAGLWTLPQQEVEAKSEKAPKKLSDTKLEAKQTFTQTFAKEKVQEKVKEIFGIYALLLEGKQFVYKKQPTTLDLLLAAHTLLLIVPPFPDTHIKELAQEWYTSLPEHAKRIQDIAFAPDRPKFSVHPSRSSFWDLIPSRHIIKSVRTKNLEKTPEDVEYERLTWGFVGLALGSIVSYFAIMGPPIRIVIKQIDEGEGGREDEEGEDSEDEADEAGAVQKEGLVEDELT